MFFLPIKVLLLFSLVFSIRVWASRPLPELIADLESDNPYRVSKAADEIFVLGNAAAPAVSALNQAVKFPSRYKGQGSELALSARAAAMRALAMIGPEAMTAAPTIFNIKIKAAVHEAAGSPILGLQGQYCDFFFIKMGIAALGFLVEQSRSKVELERFSAIELLGALSQKYSDPALIEALSDRLSDSDFLLANRAAVFLSEMGERALSSVPRFAYVLNHSALIVEHLRWKKLSGRMDSLGVLAKAAAKIDASNPHVRAGIRHLVATAVRHKYLELAEGMQRLLLAIDPGLISAEESQALADAEVRSTLKKQLERHPRRPLTPEFGAHLGRDLVQASSPFRRTALQRLAAAGVSDEYLLALLANLTQSEDPDIALDIQSVSACALLAKLAAQNYPRPPD